MKACPTAQPLLLQREDWRPGVKTIVWLCSGGFVGIHAGTARPIEDRSRRPLEHASKYKSEAPSGRTQVIKTKSVQVTKLFLHLPIFVAQTLSHRVTQAIT